MLWQIAIAGGNTFIIALDGYFFSSRMRIMKQPVSLCMLSRTKVLILLGLIVFAECIMEWSYSHCWHYVV